MGCKIAQIVAGKAQKFDHRLNLFLEEDYPCPMKYWKKYA